MWKRYIVSFVLLCAVLFSIVALDAKESKAVALVNAFIQYYQSVGSEKAFAAANDQKGQFVDGEFYLFVIDLNAKTYVHGGTPSLIGKNNYDVKDSDGVFFFRQFIELAREKKEGWSDYRWSNPVSKKIEKKHTFVKMIPGTDFVVGCGFYSSK